MKLKRLITICLATFVLAAQSMVAQNELISAETFADMVKENPDIVIIDANKSKGYKAAHLKNAIYLNHNDLYMDGDIAGIIKSPKELATIFGQLGIGEGRTVVLTDDGSNKYTSRVFWVLQYLGYDNVLILHKDSKLWRDARLAQTSKPGSTSPVLFVPSIRPEIMATIEDVDLAIGNDNIILVDARTKEEYVGDHKNSEGHIPSAIHLNYEDLLTSTGAFKSRDEIKLIADGLGLTPDKELIFYCRTSVRAGVHYYAFKKILGYDNVKVYDGAYNEWFAKREVVQ